jgi:2-keto-4-pentenoate hydratase/2-oxohepta-3-ene-1,7-dioic acid hydratase in catechol pathway
MKPASALVPPGRAVPWPGHGGELHFETELVVGVGAAGRPADESEALGFIAGFTLGFDLTLRDVQQRAKESGHPWEAAKAFDHSAPCGGLVPAAHQRFEFTGQVNGAIRQRGDTADMLFPVPRLLVEISRIWALAPGDLVFTGTPAGVGPLARGDELAAESPALGRFTWRMEA